MPTYHEYLRVADNILKNKQPSRALLMLKEAQALNPDDPIITDKLIETYVALHDYHHAIVLTQQLLAKWPAAVILWNNLGYYHSALGDYVKAISAYDQAITLNPAWIPSYLGRVDALRASGEFDRALDDCHIMIKMDPKQLSAYHRLTWLLIIKDKLPEALAVANDVLASEPGNIFALLNRGYTYQLMGLLTEHKRDWEDAKCFWSADRLPEAPSAYFKLGKTWEKLHLNKQAESCYLMALVLAPGYPLAHDALKHLIAHTAIASTSLLSPKAATTEFAKSEMDLAALESKLLTKIETVKAELKAEYVSPKPDWSDTEIGFLKAFAIKQTLEASELAHIDSSPALKGYHEVFKRCTYQAFVACLAINSDMIAPSSVGSATSVIEGAISSASFLFEKFTSSLPFLSQVSALLAISAERIIKIRASNRVKNLLHCFDATHAHEQIAYVSAKLTLQYEALITEQKPSSTNLLLQFFKRMKDKVIVQEIDTPAKALAAKHAQEIIALAMCGELKVFSHELIHKQLSAELDSKAVIFATASPSAESVSDAACPY